MIELPKLAEADGTLTIMVDTDVLEVLLGEHMVAAVYRPVVMSHDYWSFTFVLDDTVVPYIGYLNAIHNSNRSTIVFSAKVTD
jgi:hypothetical protein